MMLGSPGRFPWCRLRSTSLGDTGSKRLKELSRLTLDVLLFLSNRAHVQLCSCCGWSRIISEGSSSGQRRAERERLNCAWMSCSRPTQTGVILIKHAFVKIVGLCVLVYIVVP